ncbi:MMPL family transporter [Actinoplanes sp. NPDC048967]|uniref:MMPL family transporter n=1 Tax=Actinoplanes sp. NPDC048967 TaxID=3155269 RepID=UPI0033E8B41D
MSRHVRHRRGPWLALLLASWTLLAAFVLPFADRLSSLDQGDNSGRMAAGAASTEVARLEEQVRGDVSDLVVVFHRDGGLSPADLAAVTASRDRVAATTPDTSAVVRAPDGAAASFRTTAPAHAEAEAVTRLRADLPAGTGLRVEVTGPGALEADLDNALDGVDGKLLTGSAIVVVIILLLTYRSPTLWLLPLISVAVALEAARAAVYAYGRLGGAVTGFGTAILTVLVFGCGTDYSLLLITRYREELRGQQDRFPAMRRALARCIGAILASAATVATALLCLLLADLGETRLLGPTLAIAVLVTVLVVLGLLPVLLLAGGRWIFWPMTPAVGTTGRTAGWAWAARTVARRRRAVLVGATIVLLLLSGGLAGARLDLAPTEAFRDTPESVAGLSTIADHFSPGAVAPVVIVLPGGRDQHVFTAVRDTPGVLAVRWDSAIDGRAVLEATLDSGPYEQRARAVVTEVRARLDGTAALVGGTTAEQIDRSRTTRRDNEVVAPCILLLIALILGLLLRSVVAAVCLALTVVLSFTATLGVSTLAYDHLFGFAGMSPETPLYAFLFLVPLGVDYTIFLMHRVREETWSAGTAEGMLRGLIGTGGVITSAGVVLAGTFAVLITLPLVQFAEVGFAVTLGVLLDALVVRATLVPAVVLTLGDRIWWPARAPGGPRTGQLSTLEPTRPFNSRIDVASTPDH